MECGFPRSGKIYTLFTAIVLNLNYCDHNISPQISWNLSYILTNKNQRGQSIYFWPLLLLFAPSSRDSTKDQTNGFLPVVRLPVCQCDPGRNGMRIFLDRLEDNTMYDHGLYSRCASAKLLIHLLEWWKLFVTHAFVTAGPEPPTTFSVRLFFLFDLVYSLLSWSSSGNFIQGCRDKFMDGSRFNGADAHAGRDAAAAAAVSAG